MHIHRGDALPEGHAGSVFIMESAQNLVQRQVLATDGVSFRSRPAREGVEFEPARVPPDARLPRSLFDSIADNLIRNALAKRAADGPTRVQASLEHRGRLVLRVQDNGSAVPAELARDLFRRPVASAGGLGIGLYQAARPAEAPGDLVAMRLQLPDDLPRERVDPSDLPRGWNGIAAHPACVRRGDLWAGEGRAALLLVPSAIVPEEENVLISSRHPGAARLAVIDTRPFAFDPRLLG